MGTYPVECVNVDDSSSYSDCRCITTIGIPNTDGGTNTYTPARIHDRIEDEGDEFYIKHDGSRTYLEAVERVGTKYVRAEPNDTEDDNLLEQPSC
ncbi:DUF3892 domain-containing protein [Natrialba sp. SSL1]|uniref:DUF3892 domain-containing protein n=1 Tax=Natrialba sp. SSL1 TaxID=1869245 RepID=UPI0014960F7A